ncbi:thiamine phosphate synthase [Magnetovibrio sp.]|uniref:thiamine phosphate synthase n=1 Tax=Magnetovibrio sp. TaxID=2024836 RepID=UPI002F939656
MAKLAKLGARYNCVRPGQTIKSLPLCYVLSDIQRLPDPGILLARLPRGACVILRHDDNDALANLAYRIIPRARIRGIKVLIANDLRLALRCKADGVHYSERVARRGQSRLVFRKPSFIVSAAAHNRLALWRAARAGADIALLSPVFATRSHPNAKFLGILRFAVLARMSAIPVVPLGGVSLLNARRLRFGPGYGFAAIDAWKN